MAPKKKAGRATVLEPEDPEATIAVNVTVSSGNAIFDEDFEGSGEVRLSYVFPGKESFPFVQEEPTLPNDDGEYAYNLTHAFRVHPTKDALHAMINGRLTFQIINADDDTDVAVGAIDLLPFALGESTIVEGLKMSKAGELPIFEDAKLMVEVTLEEMPPPKEEAEEGGEGEEEAAAAAPPAEGEEPPGPEDTEEAAPVEAEGPKPFRYVSEADAADGAVVTFKVAPVGPVPPGLQAASDLVKGALELHTGFSIPTREGPVRVVLKKGRLEGDTVKWPEAGVRTVLSADTIRSLREAMEDQEPFWVEVARYVEDPTLFQDPAWVAYKGGASVPAAHELLLNPGTMEHALADLPLEAHPDPSGPEAALPAPPPPGGKEKVIEPAPEAGTNGWADAGSKISASLTWSRPVCPPWEPPPPPPKSLAELIPKRDLTKKPPPTTATDEYKAQITDIAVGLAHEYNAMFSSQMPGNPEINPPGHDEVTARHKRMAFELNRSGKYLEMKNRLKRSVVKIVKEKYRKSGDMGKEEMAELYNDLYVYLVDQMHGALNTLAGPPLPGSGAEVEPAEQPVPDAATLARLKDLADEYEVNGDVARAARHHQERLVAAAEPDVWYDYGTFSMRTGSLGRAEECFREALALQPDHVDACLALACLAWHNGVHTDPLHLATAEAAAHGAREADAGDARPWALLSLVYRADRSGGRAKEDALRNAQHRAVKLSRGTPPAAKEDSDEAPPPPPPLQVNVYLRLALLLLDLQLPSCAEDALHFAAKLKESAEALSAEIVMCRSRIRHLQGDDAGALALLKDAVRAAGADDVRPLILRGNVHHGAGRLTEARDDYQAAMTASPAQCPLDLYLRLADGLSKSGEWEAAARVYGHACGVAPCASTWLGAGVAYLRLGQLGPADLALTEANILDHRHPGVWGHLALVAVLDGREGEAASALAHAVREGYDDAAVLTEIAAVYLGQGKTADAQPILKRLIVSQDSSLVRTMLGDSYEEQDEHAAAAAQYEVALATAQEAPARAAVAAKLRVVCDKLGDEARSAELKEAYPPGAEAAAAAS